MPGGWTQESYRRAWDALGGSFEHCVSSVSGVDDPQAFCAWLHHESVGKWPSEKSQIIISREAFLKSLPCCAHKFDLGARVFVEINKSKFQSALEEILKSKGIDVFARPVVKSEPGLFILGREAVIEKDIPFKFMASVVKAEEDTENKKFYVIGVASDTATDREDEIVSEKAQKEMSEQIAQGDIRLMASHRAEWNDDLGRVIEAKVSDDGLMIKSEIDQTDALAMKLWQSLKSGKQLGMSIGGIIKKAFHKYDATLKKYIRVLDSLTLDHIAVTARPVNPRTWLSAMAKALDTEVEKAMGITVEEALKLLEQAIVEGSEEKTKSAREQLVTALKEQKIAAGKAEDVALNEATAEAEAKENEMKQAKAAASAASQKSTVTLEVTSEQADAVKSFLKDGDAIKAELDSAKAALKAATDDITKLKSDLATALATRKSATSAGAGGANPPGLDNMKALVEEIKKSEEYRRLPIGRRIAYLDSKIDEARKR